MKRKLALLIAVFVLLAIPAAWLNTQQGVFWGDRFLRRTASGYGPITMVRQENTAHFTGTIEGFSWAGTVRRDGDTMTVAFPDGETIAGTWNGKYLCDPDGMPYIFTTDMITISVGNEPVPPSRVSQAHLLCRMEQEDTEQRGSLWCIAVGLVLYVIGALSILFPDTMHFFGGRWLYDHAELSDAGRFLQRGAGWLGLAVAAFVMYLPLFYFLVR